MSSRDGLIRPSRHPKPFLHRSMDVQPYPASEKSRHNFEVPAWIV